MKHIGYNGTLSQADYSGFYCNSGTRKVTVANSTYNGFILAVEPKQIINIDGQIVSCATCASVPKLNEPVLRVITNISEGPIEVQAGEKYILITVQIPTEISVKYGIKNDLSTIKDINIPALQNALVKIEESYYNADNRIKEIEKITTAVLSPIDLSDGKVGVYNANSTTLEFIDLQGFISKIINVSEGQAYKYKSYLGGETMAAVIMYDSNNNKIGFIDKGNSTTVENYFIVPANVAKIAFTSKSTTLGYYIGLASYIDISALQAKSAEIEVELNDIQQSIQEFEKKYIVIASKNIWNGNTVDGVISVTGSLSKSDSYEIAKSTDLIPIKPKTYYYLSGRNGDIKSLRCVASDKSTKMKVLAPATGEEGASNIYYYLPNADGKTSILNGQFKTPENAAYVQISLAMNTGTWDSIMLEEIGASYIEDFTPSPYEPYDDTESINGEKVTGISEVKVEIKDIKEKLETLSSPTPKVLLVGSSHGMNTISQLPWLFYRGGYSDIKIGNVYVGSFMIGELAQRIKNNSTLPYQEFNDIDTPAWGKNKGFKYMSELLNMGWDVISLQRSANEDETWATEQSSAFGYVLNYISEYCKTNNIKAPRILFNSGFADSNSDSGESMTHTNSIMNTAKQMKKEFGIEIVPTAIALRNARATWLNTIGAYINHNECPQTSKLAKFKQALRCQCRHRNRICRHSM